MQTIVLRIVLSGLIAVVGGVEENGSKWYDKAFLLDTSTTHKANVFLVEGDCIPPSVCSRPPILGGYADLGTLEGPPVQLVEFENISGPAKPTGGRGATDRLPESVTVSRDATWSVPLSKANTKATLKDCSDPAAACDLEAIVHLPGGDLSTCHFFHSLDWGFGVQAVQAAFEPCGPDCQLEPQALGNALVVERKVKIDPTAGVTLKVGGDSFTLRPSQAEPARITLLVMNDERSSSSPTSTLDVLTDLLNYTTGVAGYGSHKHFSHYESILNVGVGSVELPVPDPEPPHLNKRVSVRGRMECEQYFKTLDTAAAEATRQVLEVYDSRGWEDREQQFSEEVKNSLNWDSRQLALWGILSWPHSASECDTSTYP